MLLLADLCDFSSLCLQFEKPGRREKFDYPDMALEAGIVLCFILEYVVILTVLRYFCDQPILLCKFDITDLI